MITALEPGRKVSGTRTEPFGGTVEWTYEFLPHAQGTEVVESYKALVPVSRFGWVIITFFSSPDRARVQREGMERTLERIRAHVESSPGPSQSVWTTRT